MNKNPHYPEYAYELNMESPAYRGLTAAGFNIEQFLPQIRRAFSGEKILEALIILNCVCGKTEVGIITQYPPFDNYLHDKRVDVAQWLEDVGALSEEHLKEDGYDLKQVKHIRQLFEKHAYE